MHNLNAVNFSKGTNVGNLSFASARCLHRSHYALRSLVCARSWHMKTKQDRDTSSVTRTLSPVQTDGTLLANNSQRCWMLHVAFVCKMNECMLLYVAACCWELLRKVWNRSNSWANNCPSQYFFCSMIADVGSMLDPFSHLFQHCCSWPRMRITQWYTPFRDHPTMHCRSQHCWELLHPFAHHCCKERNNSQHCWPNNVGSCSVRLQVALRNSTIVFVCNLLEISESLTTCASG